jgi:hypothetical protein
MGSSASSDRQDQRRQNGQQQNGQQQQQRQQTVVVPQHQRAQSNANPQQQRAGSQQQVVMQRPPQQQQQPQQQKPVVGGVSDVQTVKNLCTVNMDSVKFDTAASMLHFTTNTTVPCSLEVHAAVRVDVMHGTAMITPNTPKGPPPKMNIGVSEETAHDVFVDISAMSDAEKKYLLEYPKQLPVVLTIAYDNDGNRQQEHTLVALQPACSVVTQLVEAAGSIYKVENLFGAEHVAATVADGDASPAEGAAVEIDDDDNTCVICLTEEKDTAVMPCRHMCLCKGCAEQLRVQSPKCPVCRGPIAQLVAMKH